MFVCEKSSEWGVRRKATQGSGCVNLQKITRHTNRLLFKLVGMSKEATAQSEKTLQQKSDLQSVGGGSVRSGADAAPEADPAKPDGMGEHSKRPREPKMVYVPERG
eukprot:TRINITY_DN8665_c0_g1_i1.p3 TRINITY_DN8665_c0_g1~~TRINITY_DN8665_c0_g1_i1.p3  ORF type:complete len:106 (-),score=0.06 TRINITY_DN8665_c0_g1_i1:1135-1452(-)